MKGSFPPVLSPSATPIKNWMSSCASTPGADALFSPIVLVLGDADQRVSCLDCLRFDGFQLADVAKHVTEGANPLVSAAANNKIDKNDKQCEYAQNVSEDMTGVDIGLALLVHGPFGVFAQQAFQPLRR